MTGRRVRYVEHELLHVQDLNGEQSYLLGLRRRHNLSQHTWGIVSGLALRLCGDCFTPADAAGVPISGDAGFQVQPGLAVDGYGRELVLAAPLFVPWLTPPATTGGPPVDLFGQLAGPGDGSAGQAIAVSLIYGLIPDPATVPPGGTIPQDQFAAWIEQPRLFLEPGPQPGDEPDRRWPAVVAERYPQPIDFALLDPAVDDPDCTWPVFLGLLQRTPRPAAKGAPPAYDYAYLPAGRPYCGLVGDSVATPAAAAGLRFSGTGAAGAASFAVTLPVAGGALTDERLVIDGTGNVTLGGPLDIARQPPLTGEATAAASHLQVADRLLMASSAPAPAGELAAAATATDQASLPPAPGLALVALPAPATGQPWSVYVAQWVDNGVDRTQMRFEIFDPGDKGDPARSQFAIGRATAAGPFAPTLVAAADGTVTVYGTLVVGGKLVQSPVPADTTDPRFSQVVLNGLGQGVRTVLNTASALAARIIWTAAPSSQAGGWDYTVQVTNVGPDPITTVAYYARTSIVGNPAKVDPTVVLGTPLPSLAPNATAAPRTGHVDFDKGTTGEITVAVTVSGVGPSYATTFAVANVAVPIE